jgi:hypothetical protein
VLSALRVPLLRVPHSQRCTENGVPVVCWFEAKGTKGAMKLSRDGLSLILFDAKYPFIRRKRKFGEGPPDQCIPSPRTRARSHSLAHALSTLAARSPIWLARTCTRPPRSPALRCVITKGSGGTVGMAVTTLLVGAGALWACVCVGQRTWCSQSSPSPVWSPACPTTLRRSCSARRPSQSAVCVSRRVERTYGCHAARLCTLPPLTHLVLCHGVT